MTQSPIKKSSGMTMIEILVSMAIMLLLILVTVLLTNPAELQARGRDQKRLSDIAVLDRAINEYNLDNASYPDAVDTTRYSNALPLNNTGPYENPADGWIDINLTAYVTRLPTDPLNDNTYRYTYRHGAFGYELNAVLEEETDFMLNDGGNSNSFYELGNDLTIL